MTLGESRPRREDIRYITGRGSYVDDIRRPGELTMAIVRSPVAAGRIVSIDVETARSMPGVVAIFTGSDLAADGVGVLRSSIKVERPDGSPMIETPCPMLATEHVQFVGDPVAAVLAEDRATALDAAEHVDVEIEETPAVTDPRAAAMPDAPVVWPGAPDNVAFRFEKGDAVAVESAFADAAHVVRLDLDITRVSANPIETRGALAEHDPDSGRSTLWIGTQIPHRYGAILAQNVLHIAREDLHLAGVDIGGAFGMRNTISREGALAVWASRRLERPVRWISLRSEGFLSDNHGRDRFTTVELALDKDGTFLALKVDALAGMGGYVAPNGLVPAIMHFGGIAGVYRIPKIHFAITGLLTNNQPTTPYRGAGRPEATYTIERIIDVAARKLGIDRDELRRRNMLQAEDIPYTTALGHFYDSGDFPAALRLAQEAADWPAFEERRAASKAAGRLRGLGLAMAIEGAGGPYGNPSGEFAEMRFGADGALTLFIGSGDSGQGHRTTFAQLAGDLLGLDPQAITVEVGDTDLVKDGFGSTGSRTVLSAGTAVSRVAEEVIEKGRKLAAADLEVDPADVDFAAGVFKVVGTDRSISLKDIAERHQEALHAEGTFAPQDATFPNGCHICEVEIDPETGACVIDRYVVVDDVGTVINPLLMKGQMHGGIAQGVGQALMERIVYDESGQMLTASFLDYQMPRAGDLPSLEVNSNPVPTPTNPLGAKGVGEAGTVGGLPVVISAVCDALKPYGVIHLDMPATPERIWKAINRP